MSSASRQEYFQPDLHQGALHRSNGQRAAALSVEIVQSLHFAFAEQLGEKARDVVYRWGFEWALQDMVRLNQQLHDDIGGSLDLWQMDPKFILDSWWTPLGEAGWGLCSFDFSALSRGLVVIDLHSSAVAAAFAGADQPVCHLYSGLFAGAMSFFERAERHGAEVQCTAMGAPVCQFIVGTGADIDSAETMRQQGTPPTEIIRHLR